MVESRPRPDDRYLTERDEDILLALVILWGIAILLVMLVHLT